MRAGSRAGPTAGPTAGRCRFVTAIRAVVTEGGFEEVLVTSDDLLLRKIEPVFRGCFRAAAARAAAAAGAGGGVEGGLQSPEQVSRV